MKRKIQDSVQLGGGNHLHYCSTSRNKAGNSRWPNGEKRWELVLKIAMSMCTRNKRWYLIGIVDEDPCWDLSLLDVQTGSMNSMKMTMKVGTKFSSNS